MADTDATVGTDAACSCKIGRNVRRYDLARFDERLRERRRDGASLRDLETVVNTAILRAALRSADADVVGDVDGIYAALADDDASAGERTATRERLARRGVDVDALSEDFVSYQTVRTHLRECLDVPTGRESTLTREDARGTVEWARSRSEGIVERTLERLGRRDDVATGTLDVSQVVRVTCAECESSYPVEEFLERGGCDCDPGA